MATVLNILNMLNERKDLKHVKEAGEAVDTECLSKNHKEIPQLSSALNDDRRLLAN